MSKPNKPPYMVEDMRLGMSLNNIDLSPDLRLTANTLNVSTGIYEGLGPRYGMAPLPGHNHSDTTGLTTTDYPGVELSEQAVASLNTNGLTKRIKIYGVIKFPLGILASTTTYSLTSDIQTPNVCYAWIIGQEHTSGVSRLWVVLNTKQVTRTLLSGGTLTMPVPTNDFTKGFYLPFTFPVAMSRHQYGWTYFPPGAYTSDPDESFRDLAASVNFLSSSWITVQGGTYAQPFIMGTIANNSAVPDATHSGIPNFVYAVFNTPNNAGVLPDIMKGTFDKGQRTITLFNLTQTASDMRLARTYIYQDQLVSPTTYYATYEDMVNQQGMVLVGASTSQEARFDGTAPTYANVFSILVYDPAMSITTNYSAVCIAAQRAMIYVIQDWLKPQDTTTPTPMLMDPTQIGYGTRVVRTTTAPYYDDITATAITAPTTKYTENSVEKQTRIRSWPDFSADNVLPTWTPGTYGVYDFGPSTGIVYGTGSKDVPQVALLPANSGILRSNTVYELTYSVFDKRLGFETNCADSVLFQTQAIDFVAITLYIDAISAGGTVGKPDNYQYCPATMTYCPVDPKLDGGSWTTAHLNWMELRFYYRELGSNTWLPALFMDASEFFYYPNHGYIAACTGDSVGTPGGQPGDYIDHSTLPQDTYTCTVTYQNRIFWFSQKQGVYSAYNNIFEYPIRNTIPAPGGEFLGAKVHTFPGQAQQTSRLIIYGSNEIYVARFTGIRTNQAVQVDPTTVVSLPVDGSDLVVDSWSTNTAFSYRSGVIAENFHVYWGQLGIFLDDGVNHPTKISRPIEPFLFSIYDKSKVDQIHGLYSSNMMEVCWFYRSPGNTTQTGLLIFNIVTRGFFFGYIDAIVDASCALEIKQAGDIFGQRVVIMSRNTDSSTVNRGFFFDYMNRSGDIKPATEFLVKTVAAPTATTRRLTMATGHGDLSTVNVGDRFAIDQVSGYTGVTNQSNIYAKVLAVNSGAGTLDFEMPQNETNADGYPLPTPVLTAATYAWNTYFPLYIENQNGFDYVIETQYWAPAGKNFNFFWEYLQLFFRYQSMATDLDDDQSFQQRTPTSYDWGEARSFNLTNNSDGNCQVTLGFLPGNENLEGQGFKFRLFGVQIGSSWVLQYLCAYPIDHTNDFYKRFEV